MNDLAQKILDELRYQIQNIIDHMHQADWDNRDVTVVEFKK